MIHVQLILDGQEIPTPDLNWVPVVGGSAPPPYRAGDILVNETGQALGVIMHSTDPAPRGHSIIGDLYTQASGHWELRDTPARWPGKRLDHIRWTSLDLGSAEYGP